MMSRKEKRKMKKQKMVTNKNNEPCINIDLFETELNKKELEKILIKGCYYKISGKYENLSYNEIKYMMKHLLTATNNQIYTYPYYSNGEKRYYDIKYHIVDNDIRIQIKRIENGDFLTIYIKNGFQYQAFTRNIFMDIHSGSSL
jgi:hypothetical protein